MGIATLRPDATVQEGSWVRTDAGGSLDADDVLRDDLDASYLSRSMIQSVFNRAIVGLQTVAIPGGAKIKAIRSKVRMAQASGPVPDRVHVTIEDPGTDINSWQVDSLDATTTTPADYLGGWYAARPSNLGIWTVAAINALQHGYRRGSPDGVALYLYATYLEVDYNEQPVATVTAPAEGGTSNTTRPTVTWTYSDPEADPQEFYQVKIFSATQYGAGGFDPETSAATWDSGKTSSAATSVAIGVDLINGTTYRAYVKVWQPAVSGQEHTSAWDFNQFTVSITPPPVPTLSATFESASNRIKLDVTKGTPDTPTVDYFIVESTDDAGTTWKAVRGGTQLVPTGATTTLYDYEAPPAATRGYRARAVDTGTGQIAASDPTSTQNVAVSLTGWWLKDPIDPARNMEVPLKRPHNQSRAERAALFAPLGRLTPVIVSDTTVGARQGRMVFVEDLADLTALYKLLDSQRVLLLQGKNAQWYLRVFGEVSIAELAPAKREIGCSYVQSDPP